MTVSRARVGQLLAELSGQWLNGSHRTLNMESFLFGEYANDVPQSKRRYLAPNVLQAECDWILRCPQGLIISSEESDRTERLSKVIQRLGPEHPRPLSVEKAILKARGGLAFKFIGGCDLRLEIRDPRDCWRVLRFDGTIFSYCERAYRETPPEPIHPRLLKIMSKWNSRSISTSFQSTATQSW